MYYAGSTIRLIKDGRKGRRIVEFKINMTAWAKGVAADQNEDWVSYMDTYGQINRDEILGQDAAGYDLIQVADDATNTHIRFEWVKKSNMETAKEIAQG